jgi:heme-degrading monooxygenase HmoA
VIVVISRIRVTHGNPDALAACYRSRQRLADVFPGRLGVEVLRSTTDPTEFAVYTRWQDEAAFLAYRRSRDYRIAHAGIASIPGGIRIVADDRAVKWYEVLS